LDVDDCLFEQNSDTFTGGAIYVPSGGSADIDNCRFVGNSATGDGGAVRCFGDADFARCEFGGNRAGGNGGAIEAYYDTADPNTHVILRLNFEACRFTGNTAVDGIYAYGGAVHFQDFDASFTNCQFLNNTSKSGGALFLTLGRALFDGGFISENRALGASGFDTSYVPLTYYLTSGTSLYTYGLFANVTAGTTNTAFDMVGRFGEAHWIDLSASVSMGGGMVLADTAAKLEGCVLQNNTVEGVNGTGGAIILYGGNVEHLVKNCLLTGNSAEAEGGAIATAIHSMPQIANCTFANNSAGKLGGAVYSDWTTEVVISDSIFESCNNTAIAEENSGGDIVEHCLFNNNTGGDYGIYDSVTGQIDIKSGTDPDIDPDGTNILGSPLFVAGPLGDYYLSQIAAGQTLNSPALNAGSTLGFILGMGTRTTATNGIVDMGLVDIGYHYPNHLGLAQFTLTSTVVGGHGTVEPVSGTYYDGTLVMLTASPETGYRVSKWTGTVDDSLKGPNSFVVMLADRDVTVEFAQPRIIKVGDPNYTSIQRAIDEAVDGDIVLLPTGTYDPPYPGYPYPQLTIIVDKGITLSSVNPDDPACVAATIIDNVIFEIATIDTEAIIDGLTITHSRMHINFCSPTIRNCVFTENHWFGGDGAADGDGFNGVSVNGGAMTIYNGSPLVQNCLFQDCSVTGGDGARGADDQLYGFDGGWAGWAYGGAVYIGYGSSPKFEECSFVNCFARGGNGGDGGNDTGDPIVHGGRGGNYTWSASEETGPGTYPNWYWWDGWSYGPYDADGYPTYYGGYYKDYWKYSGHGGAVYIENDSNPQFIECDFVNNHTYGGLSGLGGSPWPTPDVRMTIENFGGAVYACYGSAPAFTRCNFTDNAADPTLDPATYVWDPNFAWPNAPEDVYVSYGGTIAAEDGAFVKLVGCDISGGNASIGGGIYWSDAEMEIIDSEVSDSTAYHGAGLYSVEATGTITGSTIAGNRAFAGAHPAIDDPNFTAPVVFGQGGGYYCLSSTVDVTDSILTRNQASASGGGIYFGGSDQDLYNSSFLHNCLLTLNRAGRDGGGISVNWFAEPVISNCTIVDNEVSGLNAYGGGLYCSYESNVEVINSIIWGNTSSYEGHQVAVYTGAEFEPRPSKLTISHSDIQPEPDDPNEVAIKALDLVFVIDTTGSMGFVIDAVKVAATQIVNSVADSVPDYRIGVITYEDYGSDYNVPSDQPYEDILPFSSDLTTIVNAIDTMTLGFGGDGPETVFAGLMHAIDPNGLEQRLRDANEASLIEPGSPGIGSWRPGDKVSRVIILIGDAQPKDPEPHSGLTLDDVITAANADPTPVNIFPIIAGFGIYDPNTQFYFDALAQGSGGAIIQAETAEEVVDGIMNVIDFVGHVPLMIYVDANCTLNGWDWNSDSNSWDANSSTGNIAEDPLFVAGYYLSQPVAGRWQDPTSPCVDTGSGDANDPNIGMDRYTTRVDGVNDVYTVDMGYHYSEGRLRYTLTVSVVDPILAPGYVVPVSTVVYEGEPNNFVTITAYPDPNYQVKAWTGTDDDSSTANTNTVTLDRDKHVTVEFEVAPWYQLTVTVVGGHGSVDVDPNGGIYSDRTVVTLTAIPDPNYRVKAWTGTDDDSSYALTNTVTMNSDRTVTVEFELPSKIVVSGGPNALINAVNSAKPRDTLIVRDGTYNGDINLQGKALRLFSTNPDDPNIVAQTIIDCQFSGRAFTFNNGEGPDTVIDGFTIINGRLYGQPGGAIYIGAGSSPTIANLIIRNCSVTSANGGALFIGSGSSLAIRNVAITNCAVSGGDGGAIYVSTDSEPNFVDFTITNCSVTRGSGGAVYCNVNSSTEFTNCMFGDNSASFGSIVVTDPNDPNITWVIPGAGGHGGGVYYGLNSTTTLSQCTLADNIAFYDGGAIFYSSGCVSQMNECTLTGNSASEDGGGIAYATDNSITIVGSSFTDNSAQYGGGLYFDPACSGTIAESIFVQNDANEDGGAIYLSDSDELAISDCSIAYNSAAHGGGVYGIDCSDSTIIGCSITNNEATQGRVWYEFYNRDPNDPNLPIGPPDPNGSLGDPNYIAVQQTGGTGIAQGGGIYSFVGPGLIADCNISFNTATTSGAGVYLAGDFSPWLRNCLITENRATRDGAGISANWQVDATISNCTIADNEVLGLVSYGGGLYCSYESNVEVIDSIIWNNLGSAGTEGYQVAVASGDLPYTLPSTVHITYSDIGPSEGVVGPTIDPNLIDPNALDYFIYSSFDTSVDHNWPGSYGIDGWVGSDGIHRIIHYSGPKQIDLMNSIAYIHTVTVPPGADFHSHPSNPFAPGPIAPRTRTLERTFDLGVSLSHGNEFWVDAANNEIYIGAARYGIRKFVFDPSANNPVAGGPAGNYVFDSDIAPASPIDEDGWTTQTLAYDPDNDIWYAGAISYWWYEADRTIWKYDGSQGPDGQWEIAFTYEEGDHHDGMEFINGYLYLADNLGDYIFQYTPNGTLVNTFYFEPLEHKLEGMGFGALEHFWVGSHGEVVGVGSRITEFGGGLLQMGLQGGILGPPIYVEQSCTLEGWDWDPNNQRWYPDVASHNIFEDPNFVAGYYLSQIAADQLLDSPCVNSGSADANDPNIGTHTYTTRTDGVNDVNIVDMGYHYSQGLTRYVLTVSVVDANGVVVVDPNLAHGYVEPNTAVVYEGYEDNVIELTAYPDVSYKVKKWTGTDDDTITGRHNTVTLTEDKNVTIEFEQAPLVNLVLYVIGTDANGTLVPDTPWVNYDPNFSAYYGAYQYYDGTEVTLVAKADPNYEVRNWIGTDDDSSKEPNNIITIDSDNIVTIDSNDFVFVAVEFGRTGYNIINLYDENMVLDPRSPFPTIQAAVDAAGNNYTVELTKGLYTGVGNYDVNLRAGLDPNEVRPITVRSTDPTDADVVESTIINCMGLGRAFIFDSGEEPNSYTISGLTIMNGFADYGGAILCDGASPTIRNCRITGNRATGDGGAIYLTNASPVIVNTEITGNIAGGFGGAIYGQDGSAAEIINCLIAFNSSDDIGGAMYLYESDAIIRLSTIAYNYGLAYEENMYGPIPIGGVACRDSDPDISNCIIGLNGGYYYVVPGDYLYGYWGSNFYAGDDLYECEATYSCIENGDDGDGNIDDDPLWISGGLGPFYLSQTQSGQPDTSPCVNAGEQYILQNLRSAYNLGNITTSILNARDVGYADMGYHYPFFTGPPIQYSLVVVVTGNGRLEYTYYDYTDINDIDVNTVVGPNESPAFAYLRPGTSVQLRAIPDPNYRVLSWTGTNDDTSFGLTNSITMYGSRYVFLEFERAVKRVLDVSTDGQYTYLGIQNAIDDARDGDMVVIHSGTYPGTGFEVIGKNITITGTNPDDPDIVATTIIDCNGEINGGIHILGTPGGTCVLSGITIINSTTTGINAPGPNGAGARGIDGGDNLPYAYAYGGYDTGVFDMRNVYVSSNAAITVIGNHIITNCIIRDCRVTAGNASGGNGGGDRQDGGNGGNGGFAGGAGIFIGDIFDYYYEDVFRYHPNYPNDVNYAMYDYEQRMISWGSSPLIKDCIIDNCVAISGNGANGGTGGTRADGGSGGVAGRAFGAGIFCDANTTPTFINCTVTNCRAESGNGGNGGNGGAESGIGGFGGLSYANPLQPDPENFSAYGAGVYCGIGCRPTFLNCTISDNVTDGSVSGVGGFNVPSGIQQQPRRNYNIPSYGAGLYCDSGSSSTFTNCSFQGNHTIYYGDLYSGYGGGVCFDGGKDYDYYLGYGSNYSLGSSSYYSSYIFDTNFVSTATATLSDCRFSGNSASVGGGLYAVVSNVNIVDCNFAGNTSFIGGGLCFNESLADISDSTIQHNTVFADSDPNVILDPNNPGGVEFGAGGGIYCLATETLMRTCDISYNFASGSGGGVYLADNPNLESGGDQVLKNCLITNNTAGRDGGGISVNWYGQPVIRNCTIADNNVSEPNGYGGGLYCSYESHADVNDSIIWGNWGNVGIKGSQIALCSGDLPYVLPSALSISYSDVQGVSNAIAPNQLDPNAVFIDPGIDANDFVRWDFNTVIDDDPLFVSGYYLSQIAAGQFADSNCVDAGSTYASLVTLNDINEPNISLAQYTTRIDGVNDVNIVDMGYHYPIVLYRLTAYVVGGNGSVVFDPNGSPDTDPNSRWYNQLATVTLRSRPDPNYRVQGWYDANDVLLSIDKSVEVLMDSDKVFKVRYELPNIVPVFGGGNAIQQAVDAAMSGDTLIVAVGTYDGDINLQGKDITLVSTNPDDPGIITQTIIDGQLSGRGFIFNSNEGPNTVINGFMIINGSVTGQGGGAIFVDANSSPTIKNVIMNNCSVTGADGGAIYVDANSSPAFINCVVTNCSADNGGGAHCDVNSSPIFYHCTFGNNSAAQVAGAVLCDPNVSITVEDCNFTDNTANFGGALYCAANCSGEIIDTILERNDASEDGGAIYLAEANDLSVADCNISYNTALHGAGIYSVDSLNLTISGCELTFNQAPLGFVDPNDPNTSSIIGQGGAVYSFATEALIRDCVLTHNSANTSGGGMYLAGESDYIDITNCLIINNLAGRDGGGISANWYTEPNITNCTFASNAAPGTFGQLGYTGFGGGLYCSYHSNVEVIDSIFWNNYALNGLEIAVATGFEFDPRPAKLMVSHSDIRHVTLSVWVDSGCILWDPNDPSKRTPLDVSHPGAPWLGSTNNINADPLFVTGALGSYYLSHVDAGQSTDSPCIDKGSELALYRGLTERYTTRTDNLPDAKEVDMGYHYIIRPEAEECRLCDLVHDGIIDFNDLAVFISHWLDDGCLGSEASCEGTDFTFDTFVDFADYAFFANCWLVEDVCAPIPNPSEWLIVPYTTLTAPYTISMTARTAFDGWSWPVQYYFQGVVGGSHESGWQDSPTWQDTGLDPNVYGYRVRARDMRDYGKFLFSIGLEFQSTLDNGIVSQELRQEFGDKGFLLSLNPAISVEQAGSIWWITDQWKLYKIREEEDRLNVYYWYPNETEWSVIGYAGTGDVTPPAPEPAWDYPNGEPTAISQNSITMTATISSDETGVEYGFWNTKDDPFGLNVVWRDGRNYTDVNLVPNETYCYRVAARDKSANQNQTNWFPSPPMPATCATTLPPPDEDAPTPDPMQWDTSGTLPNPRAGCSPETLPNGLPREIYCGGGIDAYWHTMTADSNTVDNAPPGVTPSEVEYRFICTNESRFSSGGEADCESNNGICPEWRNANNVAGDPRTYTVRVGPSGYILIFRVQARDTSGNTTKLSKDEAVILYGSQ